MELINYFLDISITITCIEGLIFVFQGKSPTTKLSELCTGEICLLIERLESINLNKLGVYNARLKELNISGLVLSTCDIEELKTEMKMSFGDWELFKAMVLALREREQADLDEAEALHEKLLRIPTDPQIDTAKFSQEQPKTDIHTPTAHYPKTNRNRSSFGDIHLTSQISGESSSARKWSTGPRVNVDGGKLKRKDSFVGEIIFEHQAIKTVMNNMGMPDSSEDELEAEMVTPEPEVFTNSLTSSGVGTGDDCIVSIPEEESSQVDDSSEKHPAFSLYDSDQSLSTAQTTETFVAATENKSALSATSHTFISDNLSDSNCSLDGTPLLPLSSAISTENQNDVSGNDQTPLMSLDVSMTEHTSRPPSGGESVGPSAFKVVSPFSSRPPSSSSVRNASSSYAGSVRSYTGSTDSVKFPRRDSLSSRKSRPVSVTSSRPVSVTSNYSTFDEREVVISLDGTASLTKPNDQSYI